MLGGAPLAGFPIAGSIAYGGVTATPLITRPLVLLLDHDGRTRVVDADGRTMTDFWIKQGDTGPAITGQLLDGDLRAVDLTDATVAFKAKDRGTGAVAINGSATLDDAETGLVRYQWVTADTDTQGEFLAEWQVTFADGAVQTWPTPGFIAVHVVGDVDA